MANELSPRGVPGTNVQLGRGTYVLAPISVGKFREMEQDWERLYATEGEGENQTLAVQGSERQVIMAKFILASLSRNYAQVLDDGGNLVPLSEDAVLNFLLDVGNRETAFAAAMGVSGMVPTSGEASAVVSGAVNGAAHSPDSSTASPLPTEPILPLN